MYRLAQEFSARVAEKPKKRRQQPWRKIDPKMAATIIRRLTVNIASHTIRSVARDFEISEKAVRNLLKKKGIKCFKQRKRNLILVAQQKKRHFCCKAFRRLYRKTDMADFLFVDECYVTVEKHYNPQNQRCYGKSFELIPSRKKFRQFPKSPLSAMIFGGVSREGRTPLVVLKSGFKLNQHTYKEECVEFVRKHLPYRLNAETTIFYQDKAPCHAAKSVQTYLAAIFPAFIPNDRMPPNSPDLNVLDFFVWAMLKQRLEKYGLITNFKKLKRILQKEWDAIPQQMIK